MTENCARYATKTSHTLPRRILLRVTSEMPLSLSLFYRQETKAFGGSLAAQSPELIGGRAGFQADATDLRG